MFGPPKKVKRGDSAAKKQSIFNAETIPVLKKWEKYFSPGANVLVVGCGDGVELKYIADRCRSVIGIDVSAEEIEKARKAVEMCPNVECMLVSDSILPFSDQEFDVIFMHNVCEHIIDIERYFREYYRVLKDNGVILNFFAPLFYSPYGAHLKFALNLPWGHLMFGFKSVQEIRNIYYPGFKDDNSWEEWGLNRITENRYLNLVRKTDFKHVYYTAVTSKNLPIIGKVPIIKNLFIFEIRNVLTKSHV